MFVNFLEPNSTNVSCVMYHYEPVPRHEQRWRYDVARLRFDIRLFGAYQLYAMNCDRKRKNRLARIVEKRNFHTARDVTRTRKYKTAGEIDRERMRNHYYYYYIEYIVAARPDRKIHYIYYFYDVYSSERDGDDDDDE